MAILARAIFVTAERGFSVLALLSDFVASSALLIPWLHKNKPRPLCASELLGLATIAALNAASLSSLLTSVRLNRIHA